MNQKHMKTDEAAQVGIGTMIVFIATILVAAVAAGVLIDTSQKLQDKSTRTGADAVQGVGTSLHVEAVYGIMPSGAATGGNIDQIEIIARLASGADPVNLRDLVVQYQTSSGLIEFTWGSEAAAGQDVVGGATDDDGPTISQGLGDQGVGGYTWTSIRDNQFFIDPIRDADESLVDLGGDGWEAHDDEISGCDATPCVDGANDVYTGVMNADDIVLIRFARYDAGTPNTELNLGESTAISIQLLPSVGQGTRASFTTPVSFGGNTHFELA